MTFAVLNKKVYKMIERQITNTKKELSLSFLFINKQSELKYTINFCTIIKLSCSLNKNFRNNILCSFKYEQFIFILNNYPTGFT